MVINNAQRAKIKAKQEAQKKAISGTTTTSTASSTACSGSGDKKKGAVGSVTGLHAHKPETYGLTAEELSSGEFARYIKRYNLEKAF